MNNRTDEAQSTTEAIFAMLGEFDSFLDPTSAASVHDGQLTPLRTEGDPSETQTTEGPWVLCVEDDRDFSLALKLRLKHHGIQVVRAFEGAEGVNSAVARPADVILLDYNLPNGRGDFVLRQLKAHPATREIPVIIVSGQKSPGLEKQMLLLGAAGFFAKPVRFDELIEELGQYIPVKR